VVAFDMLWLSLWCISCVQTFSAIPSGITFGTDGQPVTGCSLWPAE